MALSINSRNITKIQTALHEGCAQLNYDGDEKKVHAPESKLSPEAKAYVDALIDLDPIFFGLHHVTQLYVKKLFKRRKRDEAKPEPGLENVFAFLQSVNKELPTADRANFKKIEDPRTLEQLEALKKDFGAYYSKTPDHKVPKTVYLAEEIIKLKIAIKKLILAFAACKNSKDQTFATVSENLTEFTRCLSLVNQQIAYVRIQLGVCKMKEPSSNEEADVATINNAYLAKAAQCKAAYAASLTLSRWSRFKAEFKRNPKLRWGIYCLAGIAFTVATVLTAGAFAGVAAAFAWGATVSAGSVAFGTIYTIGLGASLPFVIKACAVMYRHAASKVKQWFGKNKSAPAQVEEQSVPQENRVESVGSINSPQAALARRSGAEQVVQQQEVKGVAPAAVQTEQTGCGNWCFQLLSLLSRRSANGQQPKPHVLPAPADLVPKRKKS